MTKRIVVIPDTQIPFDDSRLLRAVVRFIGDWQPDEVIHIGDLMDYPSPARWSKGSAEEFYPVMLEHNEQAKKRLLGPLRKVYDGPIGIHEGNHDLRPREYLTKYAPALAEFEGAFHIKHLLDFDGFGITLLPDFNEFAPDWVTTHGHRGQMGIARVAGSTALNGAKRFNKSVVMGHTHRLGLITESFGFGSVVGKQVTGFEVGNLMNMEQASYLKGGTGNWQQGFGILTVDGPYVKPEVVPIMNGRFAVDGEIWKV
ncbi:metallo-phosphoesterase [Mycobacterium phage Jeffabunny]|uniref:Calcineurin-like phosphoesterase domain-containing protein n=9 Tax=Gladiatorvirus TaxID=2948726 RepID=V5R4M5_9CAUD|nr:metallo-phosphoesterase [Mycobacterium phage CloudWang3]YP_008858482.1 metallo-phosphoesterase [Mycobacterium phage Artemis2UCLA]YP_008859165.1 metallo-phosphoesterase [Mycobacterium phage Zaka]YP_009224179.1 metallo-phosphoesterase [Mycobacterium phage VohminGhazi]YP_009637861.1 metallo-phosphoesterase [Mycobacterium phage EricB]YP_009638229.1 metallo-phosphoesterase [Mycobacterium phage Jeffabunny]YP_010061381.1 metallo-phosphoesterase [Mycobacterium phage Koko]AEK08499.1 metallophospho